MLINDGVVVVAREIELEDHFQNLGAQPSRPIKTSEAAGDGTITATLLAQAMATDGLRNLAGGAKPMLIKHVIDQAARAVVEEIKHQVTAV